MIVLELCREIEQARLDHALTFEDVGRAAGLSRSQVSRVCHGRAPELSIVRAAGLLAVVGLELSARAYPSGPPIRDVAQLRLLGRLRSRLHPSLRWRTEVPLQLPGDLRAWDARIDGAGWHAVVEAETRPRDVQVLERKLALKVRDGHETDVLLVLSDTRANRTFVELAGPGLSDRFPISARIALHRLAAGHSPGGGALLFL